MGRIFQTASTGEAHVRISIVARNEADLLMHRVSSWGLAVGDALWFITKNKSDATVWVCFCGVGMSELKVCFVDNYEEAGWMLPHRLKGRLS